MNPPIEQLCRLCRFGFNGERLFNQDGHLDLIHYTRDMLDPDSPLHSTENAVEWRLHGDVVTVVNALLSLPTPGPPHVSAHACAAALDTPEQPVSPFAAPLPGQLRWVRCPDDGRLHLLAPVEVVVAATGGQAEVLCGRVLPAQGLPRADGPSGAVCMACVDVMPWPTRGAR